MAATIPKDVAKESARRQLPVYLGVYVDSLGQGVDGNLTVDTRAYDTIVSYWLFKRMIED